MEEEKKEPRFTITDRRFSARLREEAERGSKAAGESGLPPEEKPPPPPASAGVEERAGAQERHEMPPVDFAALVAYLGQNAALHLSGMEDPEHGTSHQELARHLIDLMAVLDEKVRGNITAEEDSILKSTLTQLRMMYVEATKP